MYADNVWATVKSRLQEDGCNPNGNGDLVAQRMQMGLAVSPLRTEEMAPDEKTQGCGFPK